MDVTIKATIVLPKMPNFIRIAANGRSDMIGVGQLTDEQARDVAAAWSEEFIAHCKARRGKSRDEG